MSSSVAIKQQVANREALELEYRLATEEAQHRARNGLLNFTCYTKPDFEVAWHNRLIARELNSFCDGDTENLLIMCPPRVGKSELVSRRMPAYLLGREPNLEFISASYGHALAKRMNRDVQRVIQTEQYAELFPNTMLSGKNRVNVQEGTWRRNSEMFEIVGHKGYYLCAGVGTSLTGSGGDVAAIDDPFKDWKDAYSEVKRENVWEWYVSVLQTRLSERGRTCITHTRWHENDLAGRLLLLIKNDPDMAKRWRVVLLRALKEGTPDEHPDDPREPGEALWPVRYPVERLQRMKRLNLAVFVSLYQQRPAPPEGTIIKNAWWKRFSSPMDLATMDAVILSVDLPFKKRTKSNAKQSKTDFACFQVWGRKGTDVYLLHMVRDRMTFVEQENACIELLSIWPANARGTAFNTAAIGTKLIEAAANGEALMSRLHGKVAGIVGISPRSDKVSRAEAIAGYVRAGNCWLPDAALAPWAEDFLLEWGVFPAGSNDDIVDASTMAISHLLENMDWLHAMPEAIDADSVWMEDGKRLVSLGYG